MKVGILGGTFDPIHIGHLVAAEEAWCALGLDLVLFLPAGEPPHKSARAVTPVNHRVRIVELAIASNPHFHLSRIDVDRPGKSYTADTLDRLQKEYGPDSELYFIIGMDSLAEITTWKEPERIIRSCRLVVVNRPPYPEPDMDLLERQLPGIRAKVDMVRIPGIGIASSYLQTRVRRGLSIRYMVTEPVERYIRDTGLYLG